MFRRLIILLIVLQSCNSGETLSNDPFAHIQDAQVKDILKKSIAAHGGWDAWRSLKSLDYTKDFKLFEEDGSVENEFRQVHSYKFIEDKYELDNTDDRGSYLLVREGKAIRKEVDDQIVEADITSLDKTMNSATYVVAIPFKLLDPGVTLTYEGTQVLADNREAHILAAKYDSSTHDNHSTSDEWRYYIDTQSHLVVANMVYAGDHNAWIDNLTMSQGSIKFNKHRKSYRCDSLGRKHYLRAEYFYDRYIIE